MEDLKNHLTKALLIAAIFSGAGAMVRFEVVASNVQNFEKNVKENYVKKEKFVEVQTDIKYIKTEQKKLSNNIEKILNAVNKRP